MILRAGGREELLVGIKLGMNLHYLKKYVGTTKNKFILNHDIAPAKSSHLSTSKITVESYGSIIVVSSSKIIDSAGVDIDAVANTIGIPIGRKPGLYHNNSDRRQNTHTQ